MQLSNEILDLRARRTPLFLGCLATLVLASTILRTLAPDLRLPQFFDPLFVPVVIAMTASYGLEQRFPHLDRRNPNVRVARLSLGLIHALLGLLTIRMMVWDNTEHRLEQGVRGLLICLGIMMLVMTFAPARWARLLVLARALPAAVLLPGPHSWQALIWWEFRPPDETSSYLAAATIWTAGVWAWSRSGAHPEP